MQSAVAGLKDKTVAYCTVKPLTSIDSLQSDIDSVYYWYTGEICCPTARLQELYSENMVGGD